MKKFSEWINEKHHYLTEANFNVKPDIIDPSNHNSKEYFEIVYLNKIKEKLLSNEKIYIDVPTNTTLEDIKNGDYNYITIDNFNVNKLKKAKTYEDFVNSYKIKNVNIVNHIWKGHFTNRGNASSKGGVFETILYNKLQEYKNGVSNIEQIYLKAIKKILKLCNLKSLENCEIINCGNNRTKRLNNFYVNLENVDDISKLNFDEDNNIGRAVADLIIKTDKKEYYLSLKHGKTTEIVNFGAAKIRNELDKCYNDFIISKYNDIKPSNFLKNYCRIFKLNIKKLLLSYDYILNKKSFTFDKKIIDKLNTEDDNNEDMSNYLSEMIAYCIGYGYIYVHQEKNDIDVIDIQTLEDLSKIIKKYNGEYSITYACDSKSKTLFTVDLINKQNKGDIFVPDSKFEVRGNRSDVTINLFSLKLNINNDNLED